MSSAESLIKQLNLIKHPEGGYYCETYRSPIVVASAALPVIFDGSRKICTSIYFLLPSSERSVFHRIRSDELWHYHAGSPLSIYVIMNGQLTVHRLGPNVSAGEAYQVVVPATAWFGSRCIDENSYTLSGCTVSPGFDFDDFELAKRRTLLSLYPQYREEILMLTNPD